METISAKKSRSRELFPWFAGAKHDSHHRYSTIHLFPGLAHIRLSSEARARFRLPAGPQSDEGRQRCAIQPDVYEPQISEQELQRDLRGARQHRLRDG